MTIALYVRNSIGGQENSIDTQTYMAYELARKNNVVFHKKYQDKNTSALKTELKERPGIFALLNDIEIGEIKTVYVYKRDRLARSVEQYLAIYEVFKKHNVQVVFTCDTEPPIQYEPIFQFIELIYAGLAEHEGLQIKKRIRETKIEQNKKSDYSGSKLPYGYYSANKKILLNPEQVDKVKKLFEAVRDSKAKKLTELQSYLKLEYSSEWFNPKWNVRNMIENKRYKGLRKYPKDNKNDSEEYYYAKQEQIISDELWDAANNNLAKMINKHKDKNKEYETISLLSDFLVCKKCSSLALDEITISKSKTHRVKSKFKSFTYDDKKNIYLKCRKHGHYVYSEKKLFEGIQNAIATILLSLFSMKKDKIFIKIIDIQQSKLAKLIQVKITKINELNKELSTNIEIFISNSHHSQGRENECIRIRQEIRTVKEQISELKQYGLLLESNKNNINENLEPLITIEGKKLESLIDLNNIHNMLLHLPKLKLIELFKTIIDRIEVWNKEATIFIYDDYHPNYI